MTTPFDVNVHAAPLLAAAEEGEPACLSIYTKAPPDGIVRFLFADKELAMALAEAINDALRHHQMKRTRPALTVVKPEQEPE